MTAARSLLWIATFLAFGIGCGKGGCGERATPSAASPTSPSSLTTRPSVEPAAAPEGLVEGSVRLAEGVEPPAFTPDQMERQVLDHTKRGQWPESCTPPRIDDSKPMRATPDGKLSGVVVAVSDFKQAPKRGPRVHDVVIRDCRLTPSTIVAMKGDKLRVTSEVSFPFMPAYGPPDALRTLTPGQTYEVILDKPGANPLTCGFTAPCGRTDVIVLLHPLATVTDEKGDFRIDSFPANERVTVTAWHPLLAVSETQIEIAPGDTKRIELVVKHAPALPEPAPSAQPTAPAPAAPAQPAASAQPVEPAQPKP